jgi:hypothetical protein
LGTGTDKKAAEASAQAGRARDDLGESGRGLTLLSLFVGLITGGALYVIADRWIDDEHMSAFAVTAILFVASFSAGWLLLSERTRFIAPVLPAALVAALIAGPAYWLNSALIAHPGTLNEFPAFFWMGVGAPLSAYLAISLLKAALETGAPPRYASVFFHGLTLPLIAGGAFIFALLAMALLFAWASLLKSLDVEFFVRLFGEPAFFMPFIGAIGGVSIAMIRGQRGVLGALRYMKLLFARIAMPIMALFTLTLLIVLAIKGPSAVYATEYPGAMMLTLAFAGMLIFNGVYQNGEGGPPPLWLRLATLIALVGFPVYSGLATHAFFIRVGEYGLTPPRIVGFAVSALAFAYSLVCIAGLLSEIRWRAERWMRPVAPLNMAMALVWIATLTLLASPVFNLWAMSARSQEMRVRSGAVAPEKFDFGYLKFELGPWGARALERLSKFSGENGAAIRSGAAAAIAAQTRWELENPQAAEAAREAPSSILLPDPAEPPAEEAGPLGLEFNPEDAPADEE